MSTLSVQTITGIDNISFGNTVLNTTSISVDSANISGVLTSGNTTITGFANISSTLAVGNTTITGFANVTSTLNAGNTTITGFANISSTLAVGNTTITGFANISSNTLTLGSSSITDNNGYTYLPNGLVMQWGNVAANSSVGNITFNRPFTALYSFVATTITPTTHSTYSAQLLAANSTTANVRTANATSRTVLWQAIGT